MLHAVRVSLTSTGVNVRELMDDDDINTNGNIYSVITKGGDGVGWVMFELSIGQLKRIYTEFQTINRIESTFEVPIEDRYVNTKAFVLVNNVKVPINITHSTIVYDHKVITLKVTVTDFKVVYTLPMFYTVSGNNIGKLIVETYTSKGDIVRQLSKFSIDDFSVKYPKQLLTIEEAVMPKVDIMVMSRNVLDGGSNPKEFLELRNDIIFNTTGLPDVPITERSLVSLTSRSGFSMAKLEDNIALRSFCVDKNITDEYVSIDVKSNIDLLNSTVELYKPYLEATNVYTDDHVIMMSSDTILKESNGLATPISKTEEDTLRNNTVKNIVSMVNSTNYYKLMFNYLIRDNNGSVDTIIYDVDSPTIDYTYIETKNPYVTPNVSISKTSIVKDKAGYAMSLQLFGDDEFNSIPKEEVGVQLGMSLGDKRVYFKSEYDQATDTYVIRIETLFVLDTDSRLVISNGESDIYYKTISVEENVELIVYTSSSRYDRDNRYVPTTYLYNDDTSNALTEEKATVTLVTIMDAMWNYSNTKITPIEYELSEGDVVLRYKDNVYASDSVLDNGIVIHATDNSYFSSKLLHLKGDIAYDNDGNELYEYRAGDPLLDEFGNKIKKKDFDTSYITECMLVQYEYFALNTPDTISYVDTVRDLMKDWLTDDIAKFNEVLLEHSRLYFRTTKTVESVKYNGVYSAYHMVKPTVTLYVDTNLYVNYDRNEDVYTIGKVIHSHLLKESFKLEDIRLGIRDALGSGVLSVKLEGIDPTNSEQIRYDTGNRFILDKVLTMSSDVLYNIEFRIETV
jgi:hypothetical protein